MCFALLSCETEQEVELLSISLDNHVLRPMEIVTIDVIDHSILEENYSGKLGDMDILLYRVSENALLFTVPDMDEGYAVLDVTIDGKNANWSISIENNVVENPEVVINTELINPINELEEELEELLLDQDLNDIQILNLTKSKQLIQQFKEKFNTLSNQEKQEVAMFYNVNPLLTSGLPGFENRSITSNGSYDCFKVNQHKVVRTTVAIIGFVTFLPNLVATGPLGSIAALTGFVAGVYAAYNIISVAHEKIRNNCFFPSSSFFKDDSGNTGNFTVYNGDFNGFDVRTIERRITSDDIDNPNPIVSYTIERINVIKARWQQLKNGINNIVNTTSNWFNSWLGNSSSEFDIIDYNLEDFPNTSVEQETDGSSEFISIDDLPSDVTATISIEDENRVNVKFDAPEATLPRTISAKIKYDDGDFRTTSEFQLSMQQPIDSIPIYENAVLGNWTVANDDGSSAYILEVYPNGTGKYVGYADGTPFWQNQTYNITWNIYKINGRYHLRESGFWHGGFEQFRTFDVELPNNYLTFPVFFFVTYGDSPYSGVYANRVYTKN